MTETPDKPLLFVVDDDEAVRDSLEALLGNKGYNIRTFDSGKKFLDDIDGLAQQACLLLDIRMPGLDGLKVLDRLTDKKLPLAVIMITGHADVSIAVRAMKAGATDFIEKPFTQNVILTAVAKAFESLNDAELPAADKREIINKLNNLTPRERDVFSRLVDGLTNKEIARELEISPRTVEVYRAGVMDKMGARNLSSLVKMGLAAGLGTEL